MNLMLSINKKFYDVTPVELINIIKENDKKNIVAGFEFCLTDLNEKNLAYALELNYLCKLNNYLFQIHGNCDLNMGDQFKMMDFISTLSDNKIKVVLHSLSGDNIEEEIKNSNLYFSELLNYIYEKHYKIEISIENLNSPIELRLNKGLILAILSNNEDLYFTYDVGHEIAEYGNITDLDQIMINKLCNIHIHTFKNVNDHLPISIDEENKLKWVKALQYLKFIKYDKTLVLEYDIYQINGETLKEKIENYIEEVYFINEYI